MKKRNNNRLGAKIQNPPECTREITKQIKSSIRAKSIVKSIKGKDLTNSPDNETAMHEAAHAVIGTIFGIKPIKIFVKEGFGDTTIESFYETIGNMAKNDIAPTVKHADAVCVSSINLLKQVCAGYCCDCKIDNIAPFLGCDNNNDRILIADLIKYLGKYCNRKILSLAAFESEVSTLLNTEIVWSKMLKLSKAVELAGGILFEEQIEKILPKNWYSH